jgi:ComF family protein
LENRSICPLCSKGSPGGLTHPGCRRPQGLDGLTAVFAYRGIIQKAIKKLKYKFIYDLGEDLVELFLSFCGEDKAFVNFCLNPEVYLVPIPLHPVRLKWRGFNQAELLGKMIAKNLDLPFWPDLLTRVKLTRPQIELNKEERETNIKGAFSVGDKGAAYPRPSVLLFDDVWTSGATLKEAAKVLKRAGAQKVWGLTLAR